MQVGGRGPELCASVCVHFVPVLGGPFWSLGPQIELLAAAEASNFHFKASRGRNWSAPLELEAAKMQAKLFPSSFFLLRFSLFRMEREFPPNSLSIPFSRRFISIQFYNEISLPRVRYRKWNGQKSRTREGPKVGLRARMRQSRQIHSMNF